MKRILSLPFSHRRIISFGVFAILLATAGAPVVAQDDNGSPQRIAFGARAGFGLDPDQFVIGAQSVVGKLGAVDVAPSIDFGFGDDLSTIVINADLHYRLTTLPNSATRVYVGAGPAFGFYSINDVPDGVDGSTTEIGLTLMGGLMIPMGTSNVYNAELRFGIGDTPEIRILLGILFGGQ